MPLQYTTTWSEFFNVDDTVTFSLRYSRSVEMALYCLKQMGTLSYAMVVFTFWWSNTVRKSNLLFLYSWQLVLSVDLSTVCWTTLLHKSCCLPWWANGLANKRTPPTSRSRSWTRRATWRPSSAVDAVLRRPWRGRRFSQSLWISHHP